MRALMSIALAVVLLHIVTNGQYGFHRDELATLDDARYLAWGYVAYPPATPFFGRLSLAFFGLSVTGARLFPAMTQGLAIALAGLISRELGGGRMAQIVAGLAVAISPVALVSGTLLQYVSFDYLWWVLTAYLTVCLLRSGQPRWWLPIGAALGFGMMTKYTMAFLAVGLAAGIVLTPARRYLRSQWLWFGAGMAVLIFLPNVIWQFQHGFISLEFLKSLHARDVRIGRTSGFITEQLFVPANTVTIPLWAAGIFYLFFTKEGKPYRLIGWMVAIPFALFLAAQGRSYYTAPAYPTLLAAGAVWWERRIALMRPARSRLSRGITWGALAVGGALSAALATPLAPVNSPLWRFADTLNGNWREEIGWPDLVERVAAIRGSLPPSERAFVGILAGNYGEAGAINLYGPAYGLPRAISGVNSYWLRGYGDIPPQTVIVLGEQRAFVERNFSSCVLAGHTGNRYAVRNEESENHPDIFVCRGLRRSWTAFWRELRRFG